MDEVNAGILHSAGNRKLSDSEMENAIVIAMQNVAAGADPVEELEKIQLLQDSVS